MTYHEGYEKRPDFVCQAYGTNQDQTLCVVTNPGAEKAKRTWAEMYQSGPEESDRLPPSVAMAVEKKGKDEPMPDWTFVPFVSKEEWIVQAQSMTAERIQMDAENDQVWEEHISMSFSGQKQYSISPAVGFYYAKGAQLTPASFGNVRDLQLELILGKKAAEIKL